MRRRPRGTARASVVLASRVGIEAVQLLDLLADRMGCSRAEALELAVQQTWEAQVTAHQARREVAHG